MNQHPTQKPDQRIFVSKFDRWIQILIFFVPLMAFTSAMFGAMSASRPVPTATWVGIVLGPVFYGFLLYAIAFPIYYVIAPEHLDIRAGRFISILIPLKSIRDVVPSNNPLSSPAGSLDRLRVNYVQGERTKYILVSPLEKSKFLDALAAQCPQLKREGDRLNYSLRLV